MNPVMEAIYERRSIRAYKPDQLTDEQLKLILDAGLWAPTAKNEQETLFVVIQDRKIIEEMEIDFAASMNGNFRAFSYASPTYIMIFGPKEFVFTDLDAGIAVENMALAAESLGLNTVIVGIIKFLMDSPAGEKWFEKFDIPKDYKFAISLAVGTKNAENPKQDRKEGRIKIF